MKVSKKLLNSVHAAVDEMAAVNPEALTALATIFENMMQASTAVAVPAKKGKAVAAKGKGKVSDDLDDDDDLIEDEEEEDDESEEEEEEEDDDLVEDEDEEEEEEEKPARRRGRPAKASTSRGRGRPAKVKEEDEEEAEDAETIDLDDLETETITSAFENFEPSENHERVNPKAGIRELAGELDELGFDTAAILKQAKAKTPAEKKEAYAEILNRVHFTIDAIKEFELDSVIEAIEAIEEGFKPKGRGAAKELSAATELFRLAVFGE